MKDFKEPLLILLFLFILFGLAYSPLKKNSLNKKNNQNTPSAISNQTNANNQNLDYSPNKEIAEQLKKTEKQIKELKKNSSKQSDQNEHSPYYGKIRMSGIYGLHNNNPDKEYISITTNLKKTETIKITGWYLQSEVTNYYVVIGGAALLPFPFTNTESPIVLQQNDKVYLTKGFSPIGISFRTNACTGYFEESRTFTPGLSLQCPLAKNEDLPNFSSTYDGNDECLKIIQRIPRCTTKDNEFMRDLPDTVSEQCKDYIESHINYNVCIANHYSDTGFPGNEYRVYLKKFGPLWRTTSDTINLHDENGLIVDTIKY